MSTKGYEKGVKIYAVRPCSYSFQKARGIVMQIEGKPRITAEGMVNHVITIQVLYEKKKRKCGKPLEDVTKND